MAQIVSEKNSCEQNFLVHVNKYQVEESLRVKISPKVIIALEPFSNICNKGEILAAHLSQHTSYRGRGGWVLGWY